MRIKYLLFSNLLLVSLLHVAGHRFLVALLLERLKLWPQVRWDCKPSTNFML